MRTRDDVTPRMRTRRSTHTLGASIGVALLLGLLALRLLAPPETGSLIGDVARDFFTLSISVVIESLPFVFLGILLSIVVQLWLPESLLLRRLPRSPALRRAVLSLLGILLPVCECGNVPLSRGLIARGLSPAEAMTFLLAAPIINPVTIITTYQAFGWDDGILAARIVGGFVIANLIGWVYSRHPQQHELLARRFRSTCAVDHARAPGSRIRRSVEMFGRESGAMLPALFVGSAVAGAIQVGVPRELLVALGSDPLWSILALMLLAFVVSICSNVDAFFILSFGATFTPGAIVAFLVFGAMIDVKMLALLRTTFTARTLGQLTALVALAALTLGLAVNVIV